MEKLQPYYEENNIAIVVSSSNEYVPYLSVYIKSILDNATENYNYDVIVFETSISDYNKQKLKQIINKDNIMLRFADPTSLLNNYDLKFPSEYSLECYFRLTAPLMLPDYDKVIFTDADLIFQCDPALLYNIDLDGKPLAACKDLMWSAFLKYKNADWLEYAEETLMLENPYEYFNTGVMLLNIKLFNKEEYSKKLLEYVSKTTFRILEQDGLNSFFQTNIKYLDTAWNYPVANSLYRRFISLMPEENRIKYKQDSLHPFVIHWAGREKPWTNVNIEKADIWWKYAKETSFYESILLRMAQFQDARLSTLYNEIEKFNNELVQFHYPNINNSMIQSEYEIKLLFILKRILCFKLRKFRYFLFKTFLFGNVRKQYKQKYLKLKQIINDSKMLRDKYRRV